MQNIPDCFRFLFEKYGRDILRNEKKLYALLTDFLPTHEKELKILKIACNAGVYKNFAEVEESRYTIQKKKAIKILTDDYLLGEEWAEMAVGWLMEALGEQLTPTIQKKETVKPKQGKIQSTTDFEIAKNGTLKTYNGEEQEVIIPDGILKIGVRAFKNKNITKVVMPNSVEHIANSAFQDCKQLKQIIISNRVLSIGKDAFINCSKLKQIVLSDSIISIGEGAFRGCCSLTSIEIPSGVNTIEKFTFHNCAKLQKIKLPSGINAIQEHAFMLCKNLTEIEIPENVNSIGMYAFASCSSLKTLAIPSKITKIDYGLFMDCDSLQKIIIPKEVTHIENLAFCRCKSLTGISIPNKVISIGCSVFTDCCGLKEIVFESPTDWFMAYKYEEWLCKFGFPIDVKNSYTNIKYFLFAYKDSYWWKKKNIKEV